MAESNEQKPLTPPVSSRALALVGIAVLVALLLVVVVNADKDSSSEKATSTSTTSTTAAISSESSTTSTTKAVANTSKPADVSVLVLNGGSVPGVASSIATSLGEDEYKILTAGDDASKDKGTFVYYKTGFENDAKHIATNILPGLLTKLNISQDVKTEKFPSPAPVSWDQQNLVAANVVVVIGTT